MIICSDEEEEKSHLISELQIYRRHYLASQHTDDEFAKYLLGHFKEWPLRDLRLGKIVASVVDPDR